MIVYIYTHISISYRHRFLSFFPCFFPRHFPKFLLFFLPIMFQCFSYHVPMYFPCFSRHLPIFFPSFSYVSFPIISPMFSNHPFFVSYFPMIFPCFSYHFPIFLHIISHVFPQTAITWRWSFPFRRSSAVPALCLRCFSVAVPTALPRSTSTAARCASRPKLVAKLGFSMRLSFI